MRESTPVTRPIKREQCQTRLSNAEREGKQASESVLQARQPTRARPTNTLFIGTTKKKEDLSRLLVLPFSSVDKSLTL